MLARRDPFDAYQRVEFDARVKGATSSELVHICYDQLILSLGMAMLAHDRGDRQLKSRSLTRALTALMALQLGVDQSHELAGTLMSFYGAARKALLASSLEFDAENLRTMRNDFKEVRDALMPAIGTVSSATRKR